MIPDSVFPERMHNMPSFGGVLQFELNKFSRRITRQGFSRADLFLPQAE